MNIRSNNLYGREWICGTAENDSEIPGLWGRINTEIKDRKAKRVYHNKVSEDMLRIFPNPSEEGPDLICVDNEPGKKDQIWITVLIES